MRLTITPKHYTSFFLIISFLYSVSGVGQEVKAVRYSVTSNLMLGIIEKYPEKKESVEERMKSEIPQYIDFILVDNDLLQIQWGYHNSLRGIKIFSKNKIYSISNEAELMIENVDAAIDTVFFSRSKGMKDSLYYYELREADAMPLSIRLKDSLADDNFEQQSIVNNYPEIGFVIGYGVFPVQLIFGKPKAFMTFDFYKTLVTSAIESKAEYLELLKNIRSKKGRRKAWYIIAEKSPVINYKK